MTRDKMAASDEGYFGVSFLNVGRYGAHLIQQVFKSDSHLNLYANKIEFLYHDSRHVLEIEGSASSPIFALQSLEAHIKFAREMDELARPVAS